VHYFKKKWKFDCVESKRMVSREQTQKNAPTQAHGPLLIKKYNQSVVIRVSVLIFLQAESEADGKNPDEDHG